MYSGDLFPVVEFPVEPGLGVVGEDSVELDGWISNAVWNDNIDAAVSGVVC